MQRACIGPRAFLMHAEVLVCIRALKAYISISNCLTGICATHLYTRGLIVNVDGFLGGLFCSDGSDLPQPCLVVDITIILSHRSCLETLVHLLHAAFIHPYPEGSVCCQLR